MIYVNSVISYILGNLCYSTIKLHFILVLMEDTLRVIKFMKILYQNRSLNPCFNGRYSQSWGKYR